MSTNADRIALLDDLAGQFAAAERRIAGTAGGRGVAGPRLRLRRPGRILAGPLLAGLGLLLVVAVGAAATGAVPGILGWSPGGPSNQPPVSDVDPALVKAFPILARPRTRADDLPAGVRRRMTRVHTEGENVVLSRAVRTASGVGWIVPANGGLCVVVPDPALSDPTENWGMGCSPTSFVTTYGSLTGTFRPDRPYESTFTALVPAGGRLIVTYRDGHREALPVTDGVATGHVTGATALAVSTPAGTRADMSLAPPKHPDETYVQCRDGHLALLHAGSKETAADVCAAQPAGP